MAASLQVNASMTLTDTGVNESSNPGTKTITPTTSNNQSGVFPVPTSAAAIPLGGIAPGYAQITNLDVTNYVEVGVQVAATFYPLTRLNAGEPQVWRMAQGITPYWRANTSACLVQKIILQN